MLAILDAVGGNCETKRRILKRRSQRRCETRLQLPVGCGLSETLCVLVPVWPTLRLSHLSSVQAHHGRFSQRWDLRRLHSCLESGRSAAGIPAQCFRLERTCGESRWETVRYGALFDHQDCSLCRAGSNCGLEHQRGKSRCFRRQSPVERTPKSPTEYVCRVRKFLT